MGGKAAEAESIYQLGGLSIKQNRAAVSSASGPRIVETEANWYLQRQHQAPSRPMHRDSSQMSQFLNPVGSDRECQRRRGVSPVDHSKNNRNAIKEASSRNQMAKQSAAMDESDALLKKKKRADNASRRVPLSPVKQDYREAGEPSESGFQQRDFVRENLSAASSQERFRRIQERKPKSREETEDEDGKRMLNKHDYGRVPAYLQERKMEMMTDEIRAMAAREKKKAPKGMRQLEDDERLSSLSILEQNKRDCEALIFKLPFNCETVGQKRRKHELEMRLKEIDDGIKIFSRKVVYVPL